jgi:hypothetical protein
MEIYFSVIQRKVLTPNDFADLGEVEERLLAFERRYEQSAAPFEWKFAQRPGVAHEEARRQARLPGSRLNSHRYVIEITVQST